MIADWVFEREIDLMRENSGNSKTYKSETSRSKFCKNKIKQTMYKVQLVAACLMAVSQAIDLQ